MTEGSVSRNGCGYGVVLNPLQTNISFCVTKKVIPSDTETTLRLVLYAKASSPEEVISTM